MNNYYLLFAAIALIILIDFILNKVRDRNKNQKIEIVSSISRVLKIVIFLCVVSLILLKTFEYEFVDLLGGFEENDNLILILSIIVLASIILLLIINFKKVLKKIKDFFTWIKNRKRNISLFIVSIIPLKILMHYLFFADNTMTMGTVKDSTFTLQYGTKFISNNTFSDCFQGAFEDEVWIYFLVIFFLSFFAWYFKNDIVAR